MTDEWVDFFVAITGAGAALAGLIIVAITANVKRILNIPAMTSRAAATIGSLVLVVLTSAAGLIPYQPPQLLGLEVLVFSLGASVLVAVSARQMAHAPYDKETGKAGPKIAITTIPIVPFFCGATLMLLGDWLGLYWIAGGILLVLISSIATSWVLLVEILR